MGFVFLSSFMQVLTGQNLELNSIISISRAVSIERPVINKLPSHSIRVGDSHSCANPFLLRNSVSQTVGRFDSTNK